MLVDDTRLSAGEKATVTGKGHVARTSSAEIAQALSWRERKLDFRNATLEEVAHEFNRYNRAQIRIQDAGVRARRLNGVFNADEPESFLRFLRPDPSVVVEDSGQGVVIRARDAAPGVPASTPTQP